MAEKTASKQRGKPFRKGVSGNPSGRPAGALNQTTLAIQALLESQAEALTQKAIATALAGDVRALQLCLERLCPPRRERPVCIRLPKVKDAGGVSAAVSALLQAAASGQVDIQQAATLANVLDAHRRVIETEDLAARIAVLEERANAKSQQ